MHIPSLFLEASVSVEFSFLTVHTHVGCGQRYGPGTYAQGGRMKMLIFFHPTAPSPSVGKENVKF